MIVSRYTTLAPLSQMAIIALAAAGLIGLVITSGRAAPGPARAATTQASVCGDWSTSHPEWIFCDDFESEGPLKAPERYFEYGDSGGDFIPLTGAGIGGSRGMRTIFREGVVGAGGMKLAFGRNPNGYMRSSLRADEDFREIYYRMDLRMQPGWVGNPAKLSRATIFTSGSDWSQAMIAHLWSDGDDHLLVDPVRCIDDSNRVKCNGYNDFDNMSWLGYKPGITPIFSTDLAGGWHSVEAHVRLNDPGAANGIQEFWIDGRLEARREGLDFVRGYTDYAINAIFFENYWNDGSPKEQERFFDNIVVSTEPIGELAAVPGSSTTATVVATSTPTHEPTSPPPSATEPPTSVVILLPSISNGD